MTNREIEALAGHSVSTQIVFLIVRGRLFHRDGPNSWHEYPPPPPDNDGERMAA